ncbi:MAG: PaaI family thioesterase [Chloroflexi bacterium]|nr:PaaI family thioesterase [Chloroflexota bacterium]
MTELVPSPFDGEPSNFAETLGLVDEGQGDGWARVRMPIRQRHLRGTAPDSGIQGGMVVALADHAFTRASYSLLPEGASTTTVEIKMNFIASATDGDLIAECRILHRGRRTLVGDLVVTDSRGRLIAKGLGTNLVIERLG